MDILQWQESYRRSATTPKVFVTPGSGSASFPLFKRLLVFPIVVTGDTADNDGPAIVDGRQGNHLLGVVAWLPADALAPCLSACRSLTELLGALHYCSLRPQLTLQPPEECLAEERHGPKARP
jgi:hypothetical protein